MFCTRSELWIIWVFFRLQNRWPNISEQVYKLEVSASTTSKMREVCHTQHTVKAVLGNAMQNMYAGMNSESLQRNRWGAEATKAARIF